jgi:hypothetical protein
MALLRLVRPMNAIAIELPRPDVRHMAMPDKVGPPRQSDAQTFTLDVRRVEQAQLDSRRVLGENREVRACAAPATVPRRAHWVRAAGEDLYVGFGLRVQIDEPRTADENAIREINGRSEPQTTILTKSNEIR